MLNGLNGQCDYLTWIAWRLLDSYILYSFVLYSLLVCFSPLFGVCVCNIIKEYDISEGIITFFSPRSCDGGPLNGICASLGREERVLRVYLPASRFLIDTFRISSQAVASL
jgi:hypothetical protein